MFDTMQAYQLLPALSLLDQRWKMEFKQSGGTAIPQLADPERPAPDAVAIR
jgi:hypothetical protein